MKNGKMKTNEVGTKHWYLNNKLHRTDGPAVEHTVGHKVWYIKGKLHRINGPAIEFPDGHKEWWLNDECYGSGNIPPVDYTLALLVLEGLSK